jgi:hypothetical protein
MPKPQSFENHARLIPLFHGFVFGALSVNFAWSIVRAVRTPSIDTLVPVLTAAALILLAFYARSFALRAQDRVIRLEMRLRMQQILPPDLRARVPDFTPRQLVALRFAGDAELPALAAAVLRDNIHDMKTIKKMVGDWQADYLRV